MRDKPPETRRDLLGHDEETLRQKLVAELEQLAYDWGGKWGTSRTVFVQLTPETQLAIEPNEHAWRIIVINRREENSGAYSKSQVRQVRDLGLEQLLIVAGALPGLREAMRQHLAARERKLGPAVDAIIAVRNMRGGM